MAPLHMTNTLIPRPSAFQQTPSLDLLFNLNSQPPPLPHPVLTTLVPAPISLAQSTTNPILSSQTSPHIPLTDQSNHKRQYRPKNKHHHVYTAAQKRFREKAFLFSLLGLLGLVTLIAGFLILWRRKMEQKRARRKMELMRKGKGKMMRWSDVANGPELRFVHVDGCWFDEAGYGGSWHSDRSSELWSGSAQSNSGSGSGSSSLSCSKESC